MKIYLKFCLYRLKREKTTTLSREKKLDDTRLEQYKHLAWGIGKGEKMFLSTVGWNNENTDKVAHQKGIGNEEIFRGMTWIWENDAWHIFILLIIYEKSLDVLECTWNG